MNYDKIVKKILMEMASNHRTIDNLNEHEQAVIMDVMRSNGKSIKSFIKLKTFIDDSQLCNDVIINNVPITIWWHNTDTNASIDQLNRVLGFTPKDKGGMYLNNINSSALSKYKQDVARALKDDFFGASNLVDEIDVDFE